MSEGATDKMMPFDSRPWWERLIVTMPWLAVFAYFAHTFTTHYQTMDVKRVEAQALASEKLYQVESMRSNAIQQLASAMESQTNAIDSLEDSTKALIATVAQSEGEDAAQHREFMEAMDFRAGVYKDTSDILKAILEEMKANE